MTQQEAMTRAGLLAQIWLPKNCEDFRVSWLFFNGYFSFELEYTDGFHFEIDPDGTFWFRQKEDGVNWKPGRFLGELLYEPNVHQPASVDPSKYGYEPEGFAQFAAQWLETFRRNCYLSGANIECSAHEQIEWALWLKEREEAERLAPLPL